LDMLTIYHDLKSIPKQSDICLSSLSSGVYGIIKGKKGTRKCEIFFICRTNFAC
jgi:hypothetical protein